MVLKKESIGVGQMKSKLSEVIGRVTYGGFRYIVEKRGKPTAAVIAIQDLQKLEKVERDSRQKGKGESSIIAEFRKFRHTVQKRRGYLSDSAELIRKMREERIHG